MQSKDTFRDTQARRHALATQIHEAVRLGTEHQLADQIFAMIESAKTVAHGGEASLGNSRDDRFTTPRDGSEGAATAVCDACSSVEPMFFVPDAEWARLPAEYRNSIVCWKCFMGLYVMAIVEPPVRGLRLNKATLDDGTPVTFEDIGPTTEVIYP